MQTPSTTIIVLLIILLIILILVLMRHGFRGLEMIYEVFCRKRKKEPGIPVCCLEIPPELRPRPDPSVYSQKWLMARGLGVTWTNPDFRLVEVATGIVADNYSLNPNTDYRIEVTVHNQSTMAAIGTKAKFEIKSFGIDGGTFATPPEVMVDVPAIGSAICSTIWHTSADIGHICLVVTLEHPDDANPMNNEGQHNTVVVASSNSQKSVAFVIHNASKAPRQFQMSYDMYKLPATPMRPKGNKERASLGYLRKLQEQNRRMPLQLEQTGFSITNAQGESLGTHITIEAGSTMEFTLKPIDAANVQGKFLNVVATNPQTGKVISGLTVIYK